MAHRPTARPRWGADRSAVDRAIDTLRNNPQDIAGAVVSALTAVGSGVVNAVLAWVLVFFVKDGPRWLPWLGAQTTRRVAPHVAEVSRQGWQTLSNFILSQALIGVVDALFIGIGLFVLDVPLILPLTVLIFLGLFVPIIGAFVAGGVAVLVALVSKGLSTATAVLGVILVVQASEGNVLHPVIQGRGLNLHAAVIVLVVSAGGTFGGVLGLSSPFPRPPSSSSCIATHGTCWTGEPRKPRPRPEPRRLPHDGE